MTFAPVSVSSPTSTSINWVHKFQHYCQGAGSVLACDGMPPNTFPILSQDTRNNGNDGLALGAKSLNRDKQVYFVSCLWCFRNL